MGRFETIYWRLYLRAKRQEKVSTHLRILQKLLGCELTLLRSERYGKDNALFCVEFTTPLNLERPAEAVFETLRIASRWPCEWRVQGPFEYAGGKWEFDGMAMNQVHGYELITFSIRNYPLENRELEGVGERPAQAVGEEHPENTA